MSEIEGRVKEEELDAEQQAREHRHVRGARGEVGVEAGERRAPRRARELQGELHVLAREEAVPERRRLGEEPTEGSARRPAYGVGGLRERVDARDRRPQGREQAVRHLGRRSMEREDRHLDAPALELSDLVDDEGLGEAGKDLDDVPDPTARGRWLQRGGHRRHPSAPTLPDARAAGMARPCSRGSERAQPPGSPTSPRNPAPAHFCW